MHSAGFRNSPTERRNFKDIIQWEIREAKRIQQEEKCNWTTALKLVKSQTKPKE